MFYTHMCACTAIHTVQYGVERYVVLLQQIDKVLLGGSHTAGSLESRALRRKKRTKKEKKKRRKEM